MGGDSTRVTVEDIVLSPIYGYKKYVARNGAHVDRPDPVDWSQLHDKDSELRKSMRVSSNVGFLTCTGILGVATVTVGVLYGLSHFVNN